MEHHHNKQNSYSGISSADSTEWFYDSDVYLLDDDSFTSQDYPTLKSVFSGDSSEPSSVPDKLHELNVDSDARVTIKSPSFDEIAFVRNEYTDSEGSRQLIEDAKTHKVRMFYRRPVFLPTSKMFLKKHKKQMSYFSEQMAEDQYLIQKYTDDLYIDRHGRYKNCKGELLERIHQPDKMDSVTGVAFSKCGKYLAVGFGCGVFKIFWREKRILYSPIQDCRRSKIFCVRCYPDVSLPLFVGTTRRGLILLCKYVDTIWRTSEYNQEPDNEINSFDFNDSGKKLVTGGKDACLRVYDFQTGKITNEYRRYDLDFDRLMQLNEGGLGDEEDGHYRRIHAVKFREFDNNIFLSGGIDNVVKIWDVRVPRNPVQNISGPHICGNTLDVMGMKVLTGQWKHTRSIEVWDLRTSRQLHVMTPTNRKQRIVNEFPYCCKFIRHWTNVGLEDAIGDLIIVGGSGFGALEVQSIDYNSILHKYIEKGDIITLDQYGDKIAYGTSTNVLGFCEFHPYQEDIGDNYKSVSELVKEELAVIEEYEDEENLFDESIGFSEEPTWLKEIMNLEEEKLKKEHEDNYSLKRNKQFHRYKKVTRHDDKSATNNLTAKEKYRLECLDKLQSLSCSSDGSELTVYEESDSSDCSILNFPLDVEFPSRRN